jgi:hypothetical protein
MPNGIQLNFKFCWMEGVVLGWCYSSVVIVYTTIDSYNISWCLQTRHLFSRLSIIC